MTRQWPNYMQVLRLSQPSADNTERAGAKFVDAA